MTSRYFENKRLSILLIAVLFLTYSFVFMTKNCFSSAMVFIVDEGLLTKSQTGAITAVFYIIYAVLQPLGGIFADRWHPEKFITIGLIGAAIANLIIYFNQNYFVMMTVWALNAILQFAIWPSIFKLMTTMPKKSHRAKATYLITFPNVVGMSLSYILAGFVYRWQNIFLISGAVLMINAFLWMIFDFSKDKYIVEENIDTIADKCALKKEEFNLTKAIFRTGLVYLLFVGLIGTVFNIGVKTLLPVIINEAYQEISPSFASLLNIVALASGTLGLLLAPVWFPKCFRDEASALAGLMITSLPFVVIMLLVGKVNYWIIVAALSLLVMNMSSVGFFTGTYIAVRFAKWEKSATVTSLFNSLASVGMIVPNLLFTRVADNYGWIVTIKLWIVIALAGVVLSIMAIPGWKKFLKEEYEE